MSAPAVELNADKNAAATSPALEGWRPPSYWPFILPALLVVLAVIIFPWVFTIWMSLHEWNVGKPTIFVGLANYFRLPNDPRFVESVGHTIWFTLLAVVLPLFFGLLAALVFQVGSSRVDLQACKLEYSIVSPK